MTNKIVAHGDRDTLSTNIKGILDAFDTHIKKVDAEYERRLTLAFVKVKTDWSSRYTMKEKWIEYFGGEDEIANKFGTITPEYRRYLDHSWTGWRNNWLYRLFVPHECYDKPEILHIMTDDDWDELFEKYMQVGREEIDDIRTRRTIHFEGVIWMRNNGRELVHKMYAEHIDSAFGASIERAQRTRRDLARIYDLVTASGAETIDLDHTSLSTMHEAKAFLE